MSIAVRKFQTREDGVHEVNLLLKWFIFGAEKAAVCDTRLISSLYTNVWLGQSFSKVLSVFDLLSLWIMLPPNLQ